ncbi:hypothetical protein AHAS_Ahas20G0225600 [Arachis hypogaea]
MLPLDHKYQDLQNDTSNEWEIIFRLKHENIFEGARYYFASLKLKEYVEDLVVSAMCQLLNKKKSKRFEEQIYCVLFDTMVSSILLNFNLNFSAF